jgi:hypothetical protein
MGGFDVEFEPDPDGAMAAERQRDGLRR